VTISRLSPRLALAAGLVAAAAAPALAQTSTYPTRPPAPAPVRPAAFPPFQEATLSNGVRVVLVENHRDPVIAFRLAVPAGDAYAPAGKEGLADMVAALVTKGAGARSADDVSAAIEGAGGSLGGFSGSDYLSVAGSVLSNNAALAMQLLGDAVARPAFAEREVELARQQTLSGLQLQESQPASVASRAFNRGLYGAHPYGRSATPASVRGITRADLVAYHQARLRPQGALLVVAGDVTMPQLRALAERSFAGWTGAPAAAPAMPAPPSRARPEILLVNRPGSVQANIVVGNLTVGPADPARYAATVTNKLLGGGSDARLFDILREKKGYTYGAYSNLTRPRGVGAFSATIEARNAVADSALVELLAQLRRVGTEPVAAGELDNAKNAIVGVFPLTVESAQDIAEQVAQVKTLGLPSDYLQTYRTRVAAVTPAAAQAAARAFVRPDQALVVVVGDAAALYPRLAKIGTVRVTDVQGNEVTAASLTAPVAAAAPLPLDLSRLVAGRDSFTVLFQGNPFGTRISTLARAGDGWSYADTTAIPAAGLRQIATVTFDAQLAPRGSTQSVSQGPIALNGTLAYAAGRVTGTAIGQPTAPGQPPATVPVNVATPAGTYDASQIDVMLPLLRLQPQQRLTVNMFSGSRNAVTPFTISVGAAESVTVPAGTFQAYKVEVTGGQAPLTAYVTTAAPFRVLRLVPQGQPVELVRAK
jgi:zinc protease